MCDARCSWHKIKGLELELKTPLFLRETRKIILTEEGRTLAEHLGNALGAIENAVAEARKSYLVGTLKITIAPFFWQPVAAATSPNFRQITSRHRDQTVAFLRLCRSRDVWL